jgi:hypothetical protein
MPLPITIAEVPLGREMLRIELVSNFMDMQISLPESFLKRMMGNGRRARWVSLFT